MHAVITEKIPQISAICKEFGVKKLLLFGSGARGVDFDPNTSDADFIVEYVVLDDPRWPSRLNRRRLLNESLESVLGCEVDLVYPHACTKRPKFLDSAYAVAQTIYDASMAAQTSSIESAR